MEIFKLIITSFSLLLLSSLNSFSQPSTQPSSQSYILYLSKDLSQTLDIFVAILNCKKAVLIQRADA